jgi:polysaccharide deacetylase family protein (PEP-CTERM system associated)
LTPINAFSVDLEEGFHSSTFADRYPPERWETVPSRVEPETQRLLELLAKHGQRATFFVLGWVAERHPALVREVVAAGHEIATHGYMHRLVYDLGPQGFREDLRRSLAAIEQATGQRVTGHRAASFSITPRSLWALDILAEEGIVWDSSVFPVHHHRYGIPDSPLTPHRRGPIVELPIATFTLGPLRIGVGGGAYLRFLPRPLWLDAAARVARRRPLTLYVHPWECDPDQPRLEGSTLARLRQYGNQRTTLPKLDAIFRSRRFGTFGELARTVDE